MKISYLALSLGLVASNTIAGVGGGNGGGAIVCGNSDGSIQSAQLLDLVEATDQGLTIVRTDEPREVQLERALKRLETYDPSTVEKMRDVLKSLVKAPVPAGKQLYPPKDTGLQYFNSQRNNCSPRGLGDYNDRLNILEVDFNIENAMSKTDQAAFDFHEALYKVQRGRPPFVKNSMSARKLTGAVFAQDAFALMSPDTMLGDAKFECSVKGSTAAKEIDSTFYITPLANGKTRIQFTRVAGYDVPELTQATFDGTEPLTYSDNLEFNPNPEWITHTLARFNNGFERKNTIEQAGQWYADSQIRFRPKFGPEFTVMISARDTSNPCGIKRTDCTHFYPWTKPSRIENYWTELTIFGLNGSPKGSIYREKSNGAFFCKKL
jgi:hypothetical protein